MKTREEIEERFLKMGKLAFGFWLVAGLGIGVGLTLTLFSVDNLGIVLLFLGGLALMPATLFTVAEWTEERKLKGKQKI